MYLSLKPHQKIQIWGLLHFPLIISTSSYVTEANLSAIRRQWDGKSMQLCYSTEVLTAHNSPCKFTSEQERTVVLMCKICPSFHVKHQVPTILAGRWDMLSPKFPGSLLPWERWDEHQASNSRCQRSVRLWDPAKGLLQMGGWSRFLWMKGGLREEAEDGWSMSEHHEHCRNLLGNYF